MKRKTISALCVIGLLFLFVTEGTSQYASRKLSKKQLAAAGFSVNENGEYELVIRVEL